MGGVFGLSVYKDSLTDKQRTKIRKDNENYYKTDDNTKVVRGGKACGETKYSILSALLGKKTSTYRDSE